MMRIMRENPAFVLGVIIFVVAAFVGTIFLVYGMKSSGGGGGITQGTAIAVVEGVEIPYAEYTQNYNSQVDFYRQFYPGLGLRELEERFELKKRALDALVNSRLLLAEAEMMGLQITDIELRRKIESTALFQEGGRFDPVKYRQILASSRITPNAYEQSQRLEMLAEKVRAIVQDSARVTEEEAYDAFRRDREKIRLELLALPFANYRGWVSAEGDEVENRYDEKAEDYRRPERIKAAYIVIAAEDLRGDVAAGDEVLRQFYDENAADWKSPAQVKARHILIKSESGDGEERRKELRERASFVLEQAREGADFAELAKEFSQDGSGPEGGDLGWFGPGQMVPPFEEAAFDLDAGEISDIVETEFGYHIIKVEDTKAEGMKSFDEVRQEVEERYRLREAVILAEEKADAVNERLYDEVFEAVAAESGLEAKTVDRLTREDPLPGLGYRPEVTEELFGLDDGEISEIYRQADDFYIFKVLEKKASYIPALEDIRAEVEEDVILTKAGKKAEDEGRNFVGKLRGGEKLEDLAQQIKGTVRKSEPFSRVGFVPEAGAQGDVFAAAFELAAGEYGGPVTAGEKVWIYRVDEKEAPAAEAFEEEKASLLQRLEDQKKESVFNSWLADLRSKRSIEINEGLIY